MSEVEGRAVWAYVQSYEGRLELVKWCKEHYLNIILLGEGAAPTSALDRLIALAHRNEVEVHAQLIPAHLLRQVRELHPDWGYVNRYGWPVTYGWGIGGADLGKPEVRNYVTAIAVNLVQRFPELDGIHLDYIRYLYDKSTPVIDISKASDLVNPFRVGDKLWVVKGEDPARAEYAVPFLVTEVGRLTGDPPRGTVLRMEREDLACFCNKCLSSFQSEKGVTIPSNLTTVKDKADWVLKEHREAFEAFRVTNVTAQVRELRDAVKAVNPNATISAAVFGNYPECAKSVAQDWVSWCREGLLEFVCPMDYWTEPDREGFFLPPLSVVVKDQVQRVAGSSKVYPGILSGPDWPIKVEDVPKYYEAIIGSGADGITLFPDGTWSGTRYQAINYDEVLRQVFKHATKIPHRTRPW